MNKSTIPLNAMNLSILLDITQVVAKVYVIVNKNILLSAHNKITILLYIFSLVLLPLLDFH